jgi:hypothetical protein
VLGRQGKYEQAEEMNQRVLEGGEKALWKEHPNTLTSVSGLAGVLDVEQERFQEFERNKLEHIAEDRQQMNMALLAQIASEMNYQKYEERLRKTTENVIARLDVRELAERELQGTISEPTELTGEFREESNHENVIKHIKKEYVNNIRT